MKSISKIQHYKYLVDKYNGNCLMSQVKGCWTTQVSYFPGSNKELIKVYSNNYKNVIKV